MALARAGPRPVSASLPQQQERTNPLPSTELQGFLWGDRSEPYYAAHRDVRRDAPVSKDAALSRLESEATRYFAPVPRISQGNKKEHCAPAFNALWCDIDR